MNFGPSGHVHDPLPAHIILVFGNTRLLKQIQEQFPNHLNTYYLGKLTISQIESVGKDALHFVIVIRTELWELEFPKR